MPLRFFCRETPIFKRRPGIKVVHPGVQPGKTEQYVDIRSLLAHFFADLAHRRYQGIDFDGPAPFNVLQHRGFEGPHPTGDGIALLAALTDHATDFLADSRRLRHDVQAKTVDQRIIEDPVAGGAGNGGDRVHRHIAPEFEPDVRLDLFGDHHFHARPGQEGAHDVQSLRKPSGGFPNNQFLAEAVLDKPRLSQGKTAMDHPPHDMSGRNGRGNEPIGVNGLQTQAGIGSPEAIEKPPGHSVHRRQNRRFRSDQRGNPLGHLGHGGRLHGHDDQVLNAEGFRIGCHADPLNDQLLAGLQPQTVSPQGIQRRPPRHRAYLAPLPGKQCPDETADRAGAIDGNFPHHSSPWDSSCP